jgi:hypothetical protein
MLPILIAAGGIAAIVALAAITSQKDSGDRIGYDPTAPRTNKTLPASVKDVIIRQTKQGSDRPTKTELEVAASAASVAGFDRLGEELEKAATSAPDMLKTKPVDIPSDVISPITGVSDVDWSKYTRAMMTGKLGEMSPAGVGLFNMTIPRLVDLGVLKDPQKIQGRWTADFVVSKEKLLTDARYQYQLFADSNKQYATALASSGLGKNVGTQIEGQPATFSGILAVTNQIGLRGLGKWLANDPPRNKFPNTIALYKKANKIF